MKTIKISYISYGLQNSGRWIGTPSVFVNTWGCNFTCSGYGMTRGELSNERNVIAINALQYKQWRDLPNVHTGCYSYGSWDSRFNHISQVYSTDILAKAICEALPNKEWREEHLVFTGGEPLLGWQGAITELLDHPLMAHVNSITIETNGTQELLPIFYDYVSKWQHGNGFNILTNREITFSVSPKLSHTGEVWVSAIQPKVIKQYNIWGAVELKFPIWSRLDADEAMRAVREYQAWGFYGDVYFYPGCKNGDHKANIALVSKLALEYGIKYSPQIQSLDINEVHI